MSHYDYIKSVTLAWLEPATYRQKTTTSSSARKRKQKDDEAGGIRTRSSESTISTITTSESSRHTKITNTSLHPSTGLLRCRLNTTVQHLPVKSKNQKPRCQLHSWAKGGMPRKLWVALLHAKYAKSTFALIAIDYFTLRQTLIQLAKNVRRNISEQETAESPLAKLEPEA